MDKWTIACLGDSLTGPSAGKPYQDRYLKWTDLLGLALRCVRPELPSHVANYGSAGDPSAALRSRAEDHLRESNPDVVLLWIGANNFANGAEPESAAATLRQDLQAVVEMARSPDIEAKVLFLNYPLTRALQSPQAWRHHDLARPVIFEVGQDLEVDVLDLETAFLEAEAQQSEATLVNAVDGVHLNPGGELVVAQAVFERLRALDWVPSPSFS